MPCYAGAGKEGTEGGGTCEREMQPHGAISGFLSPEIPGTITFRICRQCMCVCFLGSRSFGSGEEGGGECDLCVEDCLGIRTCSYLGAGTAVCHFMQANSKHVMNTPCFFASIIYGHL